MTEHDKASFGSAAQQQPSAGFASLSGPLLAGSRAATGPGGAAAVSVPLLSSCQAAATAKRRGAVTAGLEAVIAHLLLAAAAVTGTAPTLVLPTDQTATAAVNATAVRNGIATSAATVAPLLPAGDVVTAAATAPLLLTGKAAATSSHWQHSYNCSSSSLWQLQLLLLFPLGEFVPSHVWSHIKRLARAHTVRPSHVIRRGH